MRIGGDQSPELMTKGEKRELPVSVTSTKKVLQRNLMHSK